MLELRITLKGLHSKDYTQRITQKGIHRKEYTERNTQKEIHRKKYTERNTQKSRKDFRGSIIYSSSTPVFFFLKSTGDTP